MKKDKKRGRLTGSAKVLVGFILVVSQTLFGSALATPVVTSVSNGSFDIAIKITNLPIPVFGGTKLYNVEFSAKGSYNGTFGSDTPPFWSTQAEAEEARLAINTVLNAYGNPYKKVGSGSACPDKKTDCDYENDYLVPFSETDDEVTSARGHKGDPTANFWSVYPGPFGDPDKYNLFTVDDNKFTVSWAKFTVVPLPTAVPLFLSGILAFGFIARRRIDA